ncbi:VOC family protein [Bacillus sp. Marseille-P3661]|uniref:VOC family protein n=1 Tax=Bacillus sp. Marseille-P3661 TaxID=1936234 RepID=UPI000C82BCEB|nr:VOC family protein [Bacillus sp. Marseille-P3661]
MKENQNSIPPGTILSADVTVDDSEEVRDFYKKVIGWEHSDYKRGDYTDYFMTTPDGQPVAGICQKAGSLTNLPPVWLVYFGVKDLKASLEECRKLGGKVLTEPLGEGSGSYAVIEYPVGAICALSQI